MFHHFSILKHRTIHWSPYCSHDFVHFVGRWRWNPSLLGLLLGSPVSHGATGALRMPGRWDLEPWTAADLDRLTAPIGYDACEKRGLQWNFQKSQIIHAICLRHLPPFHRNGHGTSCLLTALALPPVLASCKAISHQPFVFGVSMLHHSQENMSTHPQF